MKYRTGQSGFSAVELLIVVVIVAAIGLVGYGVYNRYTNNTVSTGQPTAPGRVGQAATATDVESAPPVNSTGDLNKALATLNQTDPNGSNNTDANRLDSQLADF
jgi:prepilin-type N-terminal cleavage/methylation domain-containing protein